MKPKQSKKLDDDERDDNRTFQSTTFRTFFLVQLIQIFLRYSNNRLGIAIGCFLYYAEYSFLVFSRNVEAETEIPIKRERLMKVEDGNKQRERDDTKIENLLISNINWFYRIY